jgi:hypothetical protein
MTGIRPGSSPEIQTIVFHFSIFIKKRYNTPGSWQCGAVFTLSIQLALCINRLRSDRLLMGDPNNVFKKRKKLCH